MLFLIWTIKNTHQNNLYTLFIVHKMSIILIDKKLSMSTDLKINSEFLNTPIVKKLASH